MAALPFSPVTFMRRIDRLAEEGWPHRGQVAVAWRNATTDRQRLVRAAMGIGFAAFLIFMQLGFREGFLESALLLPRAFDGELIITRPTYHEFGFRDPFPRRRLYQAQAVPGVESAAPIFLETGLSRWKSTDTGKTYGLRVVGFNPEKPTLNLPEIKPFLNELKQPNTVMMDNRARRHLGGGKSGMESELAGRQVRVVGTFSLGPDFFIDGTLLVSERNFIKFFDDPENPGVRQENVEFGIIKVKPGYSQSKVMEELNRVLPDDVAVLSKDEIVRRELKFQAEASPVGPIFTLGTIIAFCVGTLIAYQVLFTEISDRLPQYATLKAIGYGSRYLLGVIARQSLFYSLGGFIPACAITLVIFAILNRVILIPIQMTVGIFSVTLGLTLAMCLLAGLVASRRALATDPAEVF
jgi:putative ABC transport system permease protein